MTTAGKGSRSGGFTRAGSGEARELAVTLFDLAWLLPRTIGAEDRQTDPLPRSELEVMRLVGRRPGTGVNTVARELGLQPSNVSASIRALVAKGLVERRTSPDDRRHALLYLTPAAKTSRQGREKVWGQQFRNLLRRLSSDEQSAILAAAPGLAALARELSELS